LKRLYIPYSDEGKIYVCPQATSMEEVYPQAPGTVVLEPGETVEGMTAFLTEYDGELYYVIEGFVNGGGGVNQPPVADADGPYTGVVGTPVTLDGSGSSDPEGTIVSYVWDLDTDGDFDDASGEVVEYTWSQAYSGDIRLKVTDDLDTTAVDVTTANISVDSTAPDAVTNLATGSPTINSLTLTWTSPGDDGSTGTATQYDIRYSTSAINEGNWASATQATGEPTPQIAGSSESFVVSGLAPNTTYYFALKTADEVPNWSAISNSPNGTTSPLGPVVTIDIVCGETSPEGPAVVIYINTE